MRRYRRVLWLGTVIGLLVAVPAVAFAQADSALGGKFRAGDNVVIAADETVEDDLYVAAGTVNVDGTVNGDLIVTGGQVGIGGQVTGDLVVVGGTVQVGGQISGDARMAAGQTSVTGTIGEDVVVSTGTLTVNDAARIEGDLAFSSGQAVLDGAVGGDVLGGTADYERNGEIGGTEQVAVQEERAPRAVDRIWNAVRRWVSLVLVAALLLWLVPAVVRRSHETARSRTLPAVGVGLLSLVAVPVVLVVALLVAVLVMAVLALASLGQLAGFVIVTALVAMTAVALCFAFAIVFVAHVIVALLIGGLVQQPRGRRDQLVAIALGALVLVTLFAVPVVGPLLEFASVLVGLGALVLASWERRSGGTLREPTTRSAT